MLYLDEGERERGKNCWKEKMDKRKGKVALAPQCCFPLLGITVKIKDFSVTTPLLGFAAAHSMIVVLKVPCLGDVVLVV